MDFAKLKNEFAKLYALAQRWDEQGYAPDIERDIAKDRLRKLYDKINATPEKNLPTPKVETPNQTTVEQKTNTAPEPVIEVVAEAETEPAPQKTLQQDELYIQELFNGDRELYQTEIEKLIQMNSIDQIVIYITDNFNWSAQNKAAENIVQELFELKNA
ncbi:MAG: hypothetical protein R3Y49_02165 [Rikenellaceae bacterium]